VGKIAEKQSVVLAILPLGREKIRDWTKQFSYLLLKSQFEQIYSAGLVLSKFLIQVLSVII